MATEVQTDEQGRPYMINPHTGRRVYISPEAMQHGSKPADTTGIFRSRPQWNSSKGKWETPIDWHNVMSIATAAGLGVGGLHAAGAFGGGGAASAPASSYIGSDVAATAAGTGAASAPVIGGTAGGSAASVAKTAAGSSPSLMRTAAALAPVIMSARGGGGGNDLEAAFQQFPELREMLALQQTQAKRTDPLHEAAIRLAMNLAPRSSRG